MVLQQDMRRTKIICTIGPATAGGVLHSHKGVNLPTSLLRVPAFTEKDRADLAEGLEEGVLPGPFSA